MTHHKHHKSCFCGREMNQITSGKGEMDGVAVGKGLCVRNDTPETPPSSTYALLPRHSVAGWLLESRILISCCIPRIAVATILSFSLVYYFYRFFTFMWPCIVTDFFIIKPTRCTNFTNLFWHEILHVSDSSSVHHQEFIHCTFSNDMCRTGL